MPRTNCIVLGCKSNKKLQQKGIVSFHSFPKDIQVRKNWLKFCGFDEVNDSYVICSKHFKKNYFENYLLSELTGHNLKRKLRKKAIPTEYPPPLIHPHFHNGKLDLTETNTTSGYHRSAEEINTRIKNLKCFYNRIKKELDHGVTTEPTWKHYQAMDEIMTRAIFSVRPNEIPKPSLRYRLEEEKREREANEDKTEKSLLEENEKLSIVDDDDDVDIEIGGTVTTNEDGIGSERNLGENSSSNDDNLNTMECEEEKPELKELEKISAAKIQEININNNATNNNESNNQSEEAAVIKNEPIDIDDDDDDEDKTTTDKKINEYSGDMFPFSDYLQLSAVNNMPRAKKSCTGINNSNPVITTIAGHISNNELNGLNTVKHLSQPTIMLSSPGPNITSTVTSNAAANSQGKISLVPTNFLLKPTPQPQQNMPVQSTIHLRPRSNTNQPQQHHIIYTQNPNVQPNVQNGIVNTNTGSMQVLLVNTMQNGSSQQNIATSSIQAMPDLTNKSSIFSTQAPTQAQNIPSTQSQQNNLSHQATTVNLSDMVSAANMEKINLINSGSSTKSPAGYRALLGQLVKTQSENNEIQRQRLRIERERLEFEKSVVERLFNTVPIWFSNLQHLIPEQNSSNSKDKSAATESRNKSREKSNSLDDTACVSIPIKVEKDIG